MKICLDEVEKSSLAIRLGGSTDANIVSCQVTRKYCFSQDHSAVGKCHRDHHFE